MLFLHERAKARALPLVFVLTRKAGTLTIRTHIPNDLETYSHLILTKKKWPRPGSRARREEMGTSHKPLPDSNKPSPQGRAPSLQSSNPTRRKAIKSTPVTMTPCHPSPRIMVEFNLFLPPSQSPSCSFLNGWTNSHRTPFSPVNILAPLRASGLMP